MLETFPFDPAEHLRGWEGVREYLIATLEEGEPTELAESLHTVTRAPGFNAFAEHIGREPRRLAEAFSDPRRPDTQAMVDVLRAIGWRLAPIEEARAEAA